LSGQFGRELPEAGVGSLFARVGGDAKYPRENAIDVAIEDRTRLIERDAGNRPRSVAADARKREHVVEIVWEAAVVPGDDLLRGFLQVADARVVAKAFPKFVQFGRRGAGDRFNTGEFTHPTFPIRDDSFDLCLLEHNFGNPDGVGIAGATPGEVAGVTRKPGKQQRHEFADWVLRVPCCVKRHRLRIMIPNPAGNGRKTFVSFVPFCGY